MLTDMVKYFTIYLRNHFRPVFKAKKNIMRQENVNYLLKIVKKLLWTLFSYSLFHQKFLRDEVPSLPVPDSFMGEVSLPFQGRLSMLSKSVKY